MPRISDVRRGDWLRLRAGEWATPGGVAGTGFEAYARILRPLHGARQDLDVHDEWGVHPIVEERSWSWADVAARAGRRMHPLVQWVRLSSRVQPVAVVTDDGWTIGPAQEGHLDTTVLAALTQHLGRATTTPTDLIAAVWDGWGDLAAGSSSATFSFGEPTADEIKEQQRRALEERLRRARIAEASTGPRFAWPGRDFQLMSVTLDLFADPAWLDTVSIDTYPASGHTPQMLWPEDHAWVLASEIDWDATIIAGSRALVAGVIADPRFEAFEVSAGDDLSWAGDTVTGA